MKIELTLKRAGGSHIDMGDGASYHFKPDASGAHVCDVADARHIKRLMSIDGFIPAGAEIDDPAVLPAPITGNPTTGATDDGDIIDRIDVADGEDDDDLGEDGQEEDGDGEDGEGNDEVIDLAALSDDSLAALHVEKVGRAPHPKASRATIEAKIREAIDGDGEDGEGNDEVIDLAALSDDSLAALHVEKVGRAPHPKASRATIEAKIREAIDADAA